MSLALISLLVGTPLTVLGLVFTWKRLGILRRKEKVEKPRFSLYLNNAYISSDSSDDTKSINISLRITNHSGVNSSIRSIQLTYEAKIKEGNINQKTSVRFRQNQSNPSFPIYFQSSEIKDILANFLVKRSLLVGSHFDIFDIEITDYSGNIYKVRASALGVEPHCDL